VHCAQAHYERRHVTVQGSIYIPIPMSTISSISIVERRIYVSVGHKTFFKIKGEIKCRHQYGTNSIGNLKTNEIDPLNFILQIIFNG
jgi:hypothetical protein